MAVAKKRLERFTSPVGVAVFPKLNTPDTKFKPEGEYSVKLKLDESANGVTALIARIDALAVKAKAEAQEKLSADPKKYGKNAKASDTGSLPYKKVLDDTGEETGEIEVKFAAKASGTNAKGEKWERKLALFDRFGKPTSEVVRGGASILVNYSPDGWVNPKNEWGVKLYLEAVQVKAASSGGRSAADYGFSADEPEEGDFDAESGPDATGNPPAETPDF